jgi:hypothetical protein
MISRRISLVALIWGSFLLVMVMIGQQLLAQARYASYQELRISARHIESQLARARQLGLPIPEKIAGWASFCQTLKANSQFRSAQLVRNSKLLYECQSDARGDWFTSQDTFTLTTLDVDLQLTLAGEAESKALVITIQFTLLGFVLLSLLRLIEHFRDSNERRLSEFLSMVHNRVVEKLDVNLQLNWNRHDSFGTVSELKRVLLQLHEVWGQTLRLTAALIRTETSNDRRRELQRRVGDMTAKYQLRDFSSPEAVPAQSPQLDYNGPRYTFQFCAGLFVGLAVPWLQRLYPDIKVGLIATAVLCLIFLIRRGKDWWAAGMALSIVMAVLVPTLVLTIAFALALLLAFIVLPDRREN